MEEAFSHQLTNFMELTQDIICEMDLSLLKREILKNIDNYVPSDRSLIVLEDDNNPYPDFFRRNIHEEKNLEYIEYYYSLDPFSNIKNSSSGLQLVSRLPHRKTVVTLEEIVKYSEFVSSEYYAEFLQPLDIHYELEIYLRQKNRIRGFIALFRSRKSRSFSDTEINFARTFSPFLSLAFDNLLLSKKNDLNVSVMDINKKYPGSGIMIFDLSGSLLYMNDRAKEYFPNVENINCNSLTETSNLPLEVTKYLNRYLEGFYFYKDMPPMITNIFHEGKRCRAIYKYKRERIKGNKNETILLILDPFDKDQRKDLEIAKSTFNLSKRQMDVIKLICKGLSNSEIAERLCISHLTVKTHVQNIFEKTGVNSRPALVYKIITPA
jgi:DNA-binding CsgD family transcriptional regulator